jgi:hypothetical protein
MTKEENDLVFLALAGLVLFLICARQAWVWYVLEKHGIFINANVDSVRKGKAGWLKFQYSFVVSSDEKQIIHGEDAALKWFVNDLAPGTPIGIRYYVNNPDLSRIDPNGFKNWGPQQWSGPKKRSS